MGWAFYVVRIHRIMMLVCKENATVRVCDQKRPKNKRKTLAKKNNLKCRTNWVGFIDAKSPIPQTQHNNKNNNVNMNDNGKWELVKLNNLFGAFSFRFILYMYTWTLCIVFGCNVIPGGNFSLNILWVSLSRFFFNAFTLLAYEFVFASVLVCCLVVISIVIYSMERFYLFLFLYHSHSLPISLCLYHCNENWPNRKTVCRFWQRQLQSTHD